MYHLVLQKITILIQELFLHLLKDLKFPQKNYLPKYLLNDLIGLTKLIKIIDFKSIDIVNLEIYALIIRPSLSVLHNQIVVFV